MDDKTRTKINDLVQTIANEANRIYSDWNSHEAIPIYNLASLHRSVEILDKLVVFPKEAKK